MRNYIRNGDASILHNPLWSNGIQTVAQSFTSAGATSILTNPNPDYSVSPPDMVYKIFGLTNAPTHGICPGWGHGPGGGATSTVWFIDRDPGEVRAKSMPKRWFWFGWDAPLNPTTGANGSGWAGDVASIAVNGRTFPYRYTFLEQMMYDATDLLGECVNYEFYATLGAGNTFDVLPLFWTAFKDSTAILHDIRTVHPLDGNDVYRCTGSFYLPHIPSGKGDISYIGFGLDSTNPNPCPILLGGFRVWKGDAARSVTTRHKNEELMLLNMSDAITWYER